MLKGFLSLFANRPLPTPDDFPKVDVTTPDKIIAAHLMESFVKDFNDWAAYDFHVIGNPDYRHYASTRPILRNMKLGFELSFVLQRTTTVPSSKQFLELTGEVIFLRFDPAKPNWSSTITNVKLNGGVGKTLMTAWLTTSDKLIKAKEAAAKALAEMKENEAKWAVVEDVFGLKRSKTGALVPANQVENDCDCDLGELCEKCCKKAEAVTGELVEPFPVESKKRKPRKKKLELVEPFPEEGMGL